MCTQKCQGGYTTTGKAGSIRTATWYTERMKRLARSYVWWPGLDTEIEGKVKSCHACQSSRNKPEVAPLNLLEWPSKPWTRIHLDYAGPFMNSMLLIIADAHTKWLDIHVTSSTSPITIMKNLFNSGSSGDCGYPQWVSLYKSWVCRANSIAHIRTLPYHPSSNGMAEWSMQTFKMAMKRMTGGTIDQEFHVSCLSIGPHNIVQLVYLQPSRCLIDTYKHIWICCSEVLVRLLDRTRVNRR